MRRYIKTTAFLICLSLILLSLFSCSKKKEKGGDEEIEEARDVYILSMHSFIMGGISFYDYDSQGRLLSIKAINPQTLLASSDSDDDEIRYTYDGAGKLTALKYWEYDTDIEYDANGYPMMAEYSDSELSLKIEFTCNDSGRISQECVYVDGELFAENKYGENGMLKSESVSGMGMAEFTYKSREIDTVLALTGSAETEVRIFVDDNYTPVSMTMDNEDTSQQMTWTKNPDGSCSEYRESTKESTTKYCNEYKGEQQLSKTNVYYSSAMDKEYLMQSITYDYEESGKLSCKYDVSYDSNGDVIIKDISEFKNGYATKYVREEYLSGTLVSKDVNIAEYDSEYRVTKSTKHNYGLDGELNIAVISETEYFDNGLIKKFEEVSLGAKEAVKSRTVSEFEYNDNGKAKRVVTLNYAEGDKYDGKDIEEYEYSDDGTKTVKYYSYDADGELIFEDTEVVTP